MGLVLGILLAWISKPAAGARLLAWHPVRRRLKSGRPRWCWMLVMASIAKLHQHGQKPIFALFSSFTWHFQPRWRPLCFFLPFNAYSVQ
ncbi:serine/threonine transporter SstT [Salmonella enterica subsp. enterica]|nr:serine/threonine transporter SstT [Salmonella enterica subsp. enterica]